MGRQMETKLYTVTDVQGSKPEVAGMRVRVGDDIALTDTQAEFELARGTIVLKGAVPPPDPIDKILPTDSISITRKGARVEATVADLAEFFGGLTSPTLSLSKTTFQAGVAQGAILATINAPSGWGVVAETTMGGRVGVAGLNLVAAQAVPAAATGSARLKATAPDGIRTITETFNLEFTAAADVTAPTITSASTFTTPENIAYVHQLTANEPVTWTKTGGADAAAYTLNSSAGTITLSARDFDVAGDSDGNNTYIVNILATDAAGNSAPQTITGTITNVLEGTPATLSPLTGSIASNATEGTVILDLPDKVEGEVRTFTPNDGRFLFNTAGDLIRGMTAVTPGTVNGTITRTRNGQPVDAPNVVLTVTDAGAALAPTNITLAAMNNQWDDGQSVETWRGREVLMATADQPDCRIEVVSGPFRSQGRRGAAHSISTTELSQAIGSKRTLVLRATNSTGSVEKSFEMTTRAFDPLRALKSRLVGFFNYADPTAFETDPANNRVRKVTCRYTGCVREHPGGYANTPGSNAPTFDPSTKRMTLSRTASQYLKLSADAANDRFRGMLAGGAPKMSHVVFFATNNPALQQGLVDYRNAGSSRGIMRLSSTGPAASWLRADDASAPALQSQSIMGGATMGALNIQAGVPAVMAYITNGAKQWGFHDNRPSLDALNDLRNGPTTITDVELGRSNGGEYFDGVILGEVIVADEEITHAEIRGIYDTFREEWGLPARVEPKTFPFASFEDTPFYDSGFDGIQINPTLESDYTLPQAWNHAIGDRFDRVGVSASNDTENAYHLDSRWPANAQAVTTELTAQGKRVMRFKPLSEVQLDSAVASYINTLNNTRSANGKYIKAGSAISSRRFVGPGPSHSLEMLMQNPPALGGNFACFGWTLAESGGHPPETDWNEQAGGAPQISHGRHMAPRWPLMGTRLATGGDGGMARTHMDREQHSYQFIDDELTDTCEYYQDGFLFSTQRAQKGLRLSSVKAFKADLIAGVGQGENILADNGTTTGTLRVRLGGGGLAVADYGRGAKFALKIVAGKAVDLYWDNQQDTANVVQPFVPGSYIDSEVNSPLVLQKVNGGALTYSGGSGTPPTISKIQVGVNDPVVPEDFHNGMYLIINNAAGGFTGTVPADRSSEGNVARVIYRHAKRAPVVVSSGVATAANNHCSSLFSAIGARGTAVTTEDRNIIFDIVSKMMATDLMAGKPMDGADPIMDYVNHRTLWDSIGILGLFVGPYDGLVDWKDPGNVFSVQGAPDKSASLGYSFDGRAGGGQMIDTTKLLTAVPQFGRWAHTITTLLTKNSMVDASAKAPILGAGPTLSHKLAGPQLTRAQALATAGVAGTINLPDCFSYLMATNVGISTESGRPFMEPGFYSATKREQRVNVWKNGLRRVPYFAGIIAARDYVAGHVPGEIPVASLKIGSEGAGVQGAAASVGGLILSRAWSDEEHARVVSIFKPLTDKYGVPLS